MFLLMPLVGIALLLGTSATLAWGATVLIGLGLGAEVDLIAFFIACYLGMRAFGELYGYLFAIFLFGSYAPLLAALVVLLGIACVLMLRMGAYAYPAARAAAGD